MEQNNLDMTGWKMWEHDVPNSNVIVVSRFSGRNWKCKCKLCGRKFRANQDAICSGRIKDCGQHRKTNTYDLSNEYGIMYTSKGDKFLFDKEDYETICNIAWYNRLGYAYAKSLKYTGSMQDLIMPHDKDIIIDHINGDRFDNRKQNLRFATRTENNRNKRLRSDNTGGVTGVSFNNSKQKWMAQIKVNANKKIVKYYNTKEEAIFHRLTLEKQYFGEFAPQSYLFEQYGIE